MRCLGPCLVVVLALVGTPECWALRAVVFDPLVSAHTASVVAAVEAAGYVVETLEYDALVKEVGANPPSADLLVLPNAGALPMESAPLIDVFLKRGGDLIALNAPMWRRLLVRDGDAWNDREAYRAARAPLLMESVLFEFAGPDSIRDWQRSTSNAAIAATHVVEADPTAPGGHAVHVSVADVNSWDTFIPPPRDVAFPEGHSLTVFFAKGDANTPSLSVEWSERDQTRWIAVVSLTTEWQCFVLQPSDFHFWESDPARKDSAFNPANAVQLRIGLALSHTPMPGGRHEYWLGTIGTGSRTAASEPLLTSFTAPVWETLSPSYKFFTSRDVHALESVLDAGALPMPSEGLIRSPQPRPGAGGFQKGRAWRLDPLVEAQSPEGIWRGTPATLLVHAEGPYQGGVWASFGIEDAAWYATDEAQQLLTSVAARMREGVFVVDGGANYYTYFEDQDVTLGARVVNTSAHARDVDVSVRLAGGDGIAREETARVTVGPLETVERGWPGPAIAADGGAVTARVEVRADGAVLDAVSHEVNVWRPKESPKYVTSEGGDFMLDGARWRAHGVNYMPSSGIGTEDWDAFEHWIGARAYDPVIIQRDLDRIHDLGMNAVSIFIYRESLESQNLLDLLRRLEAMGMKANLSLRPGTPLDFEWEKIRELLTYYRIAEHDSVFALDLAWEPMFPDHAGRTRYDADWRAWVDERYGSLAHAEQDWRFEAPRDDAGLLTNPSDAMVTEDGPWRIMVAAYRRFLDTVLYVNYGRARDLVRSLDPHHFVSFRMTEAGDPTFRGTSVMPYDFAYLAGAVDILEPEAYGRIGDWEAIKPSLFQAEYGRWAAPDLPYVWAEAGVHVWDMRTEGPLPERLKFQAEYYRNFYRMLIETGADGVFWWWYPGGLRVNERSDYGIIEPDGTDRLVSAVIREHAAAFLDGPYQVEPDVWLTMDRDAHPAGVPGIYDRLKDEYWALRDQGNAPGLKTEATGTTSATCPLVAIGNVPYNGKNPPKYLDAYFTRVEVKDARGSWVELEDGGRLPAELGNDLNVRCELVNLGEATWVAGSGDGAVALRVGPWGVAVPLTQDVARFDAATLELTVNDYKSTLNAQDLVVRVEATGRCVFGDRFVVGGMSGGAGDVPFLKMASSPSCQLFEISSAMSRRA